MYSNNILIKIKRIGIMLSLIFGFLIISNTSAQAQYNGGYRDRIYEDNSALRIAQQNGYRDGMKDGVDAMRENDRYNPENSGDWQKGTNGYESRYGNKQAYKQAYRDAYLKGYRVGFDRNDRNWNSRRRNW